MEENQVYSDNIGKLYRDAVSRGMKADEQTFRNYLAESDENRRKVYNDLVARGMKADENQFFEYIGYPIQQPAPAPRVDVSDVEAQQQPQVTAIESPENGTEQAGIPTVTTEQLDNAGHYQPRTGGEPMKTPEQLEAEAREMAGVKTPTDEESGEPFGTERQRFAPSWGFERSQRMQDQPPAQPAPKPAMRTVNGKTEYDFSPEKLQGMKEFAEGAYERAFDELGALMPDIERSIRERALFDTEQNNRNKSASQDAIQYHADKLAEHRIKQFRDKIEKEGVAGFDAGQMTKYLAFDDEDLRGKIESAFKDKDEADRYMQAYHQSPEWKQEQLKGLEQTDAMLQGVKQQRKQNFWNTVGGMFGDLAISGAMAEGGMSQQDQQQLVKMQDDIRKQNSVNMAVNQQLHQAENTLGIARKNIEEGEGNMFVKLGRGVRYADLDNLIPVSELYGQMGILQLYDKLDENGNPKEQLTDDEQTLYNALAMNQYVQQLYGDNVNMLNRIGRGLPEQAMFTLSFLLGSEFAGAQTIGRGATKAMQRGISNIVKKEIKSGLGRFMLDKALPTAFGMGAETLYRTGLQTGNIVSGAIERHVGTVQIDPETGEIGGFKGGVDWGEAMWKSTLSVANENFTELLGDQVFEPGWGWLGRNTKAGQRIADFRKTIGEIGDGRVDDILKMGNDISQKAGWNGWAFETLEELAGNFNDAAFIHDQTWEEAFSKETVMETVLNCMVFGMVMGSSTTTTQALRNLPSTAATRNEMRKAAAIIAGMDGISTDEIDNHIDNDSSNGLADWLVERHKAGNSNGDWTDAQRAAVANYVRASVAQKAQRHFKGMQLQEDVKKMEADVDEMTNNRSGNVIDANFEIDGQKYTGKIIGGRVSSTENDVVDADGQPKKSYTYNPYLSSATLSVIIDGTDEKKMIPSRAVTSINDITEAEQFKSERAAELAAAMQQSVSAMDEVTTVSDIWGVDLQGGVVLPYNGGFVRLDGKDADGNWVLTSLNPDGTPTEGTPPMVVGDFEFRKMGMIERMKAMQQQGASEEEIEDAVDDINTEQTIQNIEQSGNEDNIWDNIAGFMQGYTKTNEEGDFIPEETRPEAAAGYLVALQKGDIGKTIGIVDARIAELQTRLMAKPEQVENNGEGVVGMAANQSLADSTAEEIQKQIGFLEMVRNGLVAKQAEQAQMEAQKPVSQMEVGTEFTVVYDGQQAVAVVVGRDADGRNVVTVRDQEGNDLESGIDDWTDEQWETMRVQPVNETYGTDGTDSQEPPMESAEIEQKPTEIEQNAPEIEQKEPENEQQEEVSVSPAQQTFDGLVQKYGDKAGHKIDVTAEDKSKTLDKAKKALEKAQTDYDDAPIGKEDKAEAALQKAQEEYNTALAEKQEWDEVKAVKDRFVAERLAAQQAADEERHAQAVAEEEARRAEEERKASEREATGANNVAPNIREKWEGAPRVEGNADEITLANGERIAGHYVLVESGAASASHDAMNGFAKTEGFPLDENEQSVNDRDYERDRNAQEITRQIGNSYDSRALQDPVVVSQDGVVLSGNGRTMAGEIAAAQNTDGAYIDYLMKYAPKYGFAPEQVEGMSHPRVVFVPDASMPYTAETFAKFNQQEMKGQSKTEQAVKLGKLVDDATFGRIIRSINRFDTLGDFYADSAATADAIGELLKAGAINQMQRAEMFDGDAISAQGREILENMLIGKAFESNPDAVRQLQAYKSLRQSVITALAEISNNIALGEYSLESELSDAIALAYSARKNGYKAGDAVSEFARQGKLFETEEDATAADYTNATVLMLADVMNDNRVTRLKKVLSIYNQQAEQSAAGQTDLFAEGVKTKQEILDEVLVLLQHGTESEQQQALDAAREQRKAAAEQGTGVQENGDTGEGDTGNGGINTVHNELTTSEEQKISIEDAKKVWENLLNPKEITNFASDSEKQAEWVDSHFEEIVEAYIAANGNKLDPDELRRAFTAIGYDGTNVEDFRKQEGRIVNELYDRMLRQAVESGNTGITLLTGPGGVGKSTATSSMDLSGRGLVYDSAFNKFDKLDAAIGMAIKAGMTNVQVVAVYNDALTAFTNTVNRGLRTGRFLSLEYFIARAYTENQGKIDELRKTHPDVEIICYDNSYNDASKRPNQGKVSVEEAIQWDYTIDDRLFNLLLDILENGINEGRLTENQAAAIGRRLRDASRGVTGISPRSMERVERIVRSLQREDGGDLRPNRPGEQPVVRRDSVVPATDGEVQGLSPRVEPDDNAPLSLADLRGETEQSKPTDEAVAAANEEVDTNPTEAQNEAAMESRTEGTEQQPTTSTYGASNKIVSQSRYEELKRRMQEKLGGQMNMGIDPEILAIGTEMAVYHIEAGARKFADFCKNMVADLGDAIRPYLKSFYNAVRDLPEVEEAGYLDELTPYEEVKSFDVNGFDKGGSTFVETAQEAVKENEVAQQAEEATEKLKQQRKERKQPQQKKKVVSSQPSLFGEETETETKPQDDGLQRNDVGSSEGLPANGTDSGERSVRTDGKNAGQESGRPDGGGDSRGMGALRQRVPDGLRSSDQLAKPRNTHNNHAERGTDYAPKGVDARIEANIKAIELMQQLIESGEQATPEQMAVLRQFSGWGGLGKAFQETGIGYGYDPAATSKRLRALLGDEAYEQANMSRNSAYYTPAEVIDTLWDIARAIGFKGGNVLEGSAGIGNIIGLMPTDMSQQSSIHAVEIDQTTGNILSLLYPDAKVEVQGFEATQVENGSVDLAITNVPFVTGLRVNDTTGDKDLSRRFHDIHDFCIAKNIRKLREGGIGIFITSSGTLDNSAKLREWIVNEGGADVVGAFRMNNATFGGTGVTSDIIVVRKRVNGKKSPHAIDVAAISGERVAEYDTGETKKVKGQEVRVVKQLSMDYNKYFIEHPEMMAGEMQFGFERGETFRPTSKALYPTKDKDQSQMLADFVRSFEGKEWEAALATQQTEQANVYEELGADVKEGSMLVNKDGVLCVAQRGKAVPLEVNANKVKGHTKVECFNAYQAIKQALADVLSYQTENESDDGLQPLLDKLNKAFDSFVKTYGNLHKNTAITFLKSDVDWPNILALEKYSESNNAKGERVQSFGKTDIFSKRVVEKEKEPEPKNVKDGIIASIYMFGRVDVPYISEHIGMSEEEVREEIVKEGLGFENPATRQMEVIYEYLSGNVREKLQQAKDNNTDGRYDANIKALERVIPMNIPAHLIDFTIGSSWVDPKLYEEYVKERTDIDVRFTAAGGTWFMKAPNWVNAEKNRAMGVVSEMLHKTIMGTQLIEAAMQNKTITVSETRKKYDGTTETTIDREATQACAAKIDEIRQDFKDWARAKMQSDPEMSERMGQVYNELFNNYVPKEIPEEFAPLRFSGMASVVKGKPFSMNPHQAKAAIRATTQPLLLAHEVGSGKTITLIATAMEMRRLGTAKKPMIVVQNSTVGQFVESAKQLYPNAKVLTIEEADRTVEGRKNFYAKIKYNDWDMIVVPQSVFERIPDSEERQMAYVQDKIEEKLMVLEQMRDADDSGNNMIVRQAEREISQLEDQLAGLSEAIAEKRKTRDAKKEAVTRQNAEVKALEMLDRQTDDVENFDDMGIDAILVDEAHEYKHLGFATAMQRGVKGVDPSYSKKAQGVFLKTQAVLEKNNGRNVVFATGTPISNTAAEIWTFMRYLMPADTMKQYGIYYFDDFVRNFGNLQQMLEFTTSGKFKENNRFAGYVNLPELVRIWSGVADTVLNKDIEEERIKRGEESAIPELEGGKAQDIYLPQTKALRAIMKYVKGELERFEKMSGKQKKENSHIPLVMYGIAKAAAVDARLVDETAEDDPNSKTNEAVRQTLRSLEETKDYRGTVAIFADNYQNKVSGFNIYEDIRKKLIEAGVPESEVVVMKSGMSDKKKLEIFDKMKHGEVRVMLGSTFTLGTGVNIQDLLHTLIHLDAPNRPMDYTQRNGRILRQGNLHKKMGKPVRVLRFGVEDSLDVTAYQRLKTKGAIADSIMNGKAMMANSMENRVLEEEEDVFGDTVAQLSGSEYAMLKNQAEKDVRKYQAKQKQWEADQTYVHNQIPRLQGSIKAAQRRLEEEKGYLERISAIPEHPTITIGKYTFKSLEEMADFIKEYNAELKQDEAYVRGNMSNGEKKERTLTVNVGGIDFKIHLVMSLETVRKGTTLSSVVKREMTYECPALGMENVPVHQMLFRNALEDILTQVVTGVESRDNIESAQRVIERDSHELEQLKARDGKPFEFEAELKQASERLEEYTAAMKKEMEEKEAKYAEMDSEVEAATGLVEAEEAEEEETPDLSIREEEPPVRTGIGYKVFVLKDGKLYPPMVANPNGEATPVGVWLDADAAPIAGESKTGRPQVKAGGKGTQGGSGQLAYRPGWHLGVIPYAIQFNRKDENGEKTLFPKDFVWAEVEYADDVDYQQEAESYGVTENGKYRHSYAGLPRVPKDGSYTYRTNPNPETDPWIITGAMKVRRILTPSEVDAMVREAGREPQRREEGAITDEEVNHLNGKADNAQQIAFNAVMDALGNAGIEVVMATQEDVEKLKASIRSIQDSKGIVRGWVGNDGRIYLTSEGMSAETPIHEYTHLWAEALQMENPELWEQIKDLLKDTPEWKRIASSVGYKHIRRNEDRLAGEVLAHISGKKNAERMEAEAKRMIDEAPTLEEAAKAANLLGRMRDALKKFWTWVGKTLLGKKGNINIDQVSNMVLADLTNGVDPFNPRGGKRTNRTKRTDASVEGEMERIKREAQANGTFMKAPNGKHTKLTERQWLQVRTEAFKKWFGDWELAARAKSIRGLKAEEVKRNNYTRDEVKEKYNQLGTATNSSDGRAVTFYHGVFGKMYKEGGLFAQVVPQLKKLFENSLFAYSESDNLAGTTRPDGTIHKERRNVTGYDNYVAKVTIDGKEYYVRFTVMNESDGKRGLHSSMVTNVELYEETANAASTSTTTGGRLGIDGVVDAKLQQFFESATEAEKNSSKIVDENGEPLEVYHGTTADETKRTWDDKTKTYNTEHAPFTIFRRRVDGYKSNGFWFNDSRENAEGYGYNFYETFLNLRNPLVVNAQGRRYNSIPYNGKSYGSDEIAQIAERNGYDGLVILDVADGVDYGALQNTTNDYVAFNPNQIKSATENSGEFDAGNPDIRFSIGDETDRTDVPEMSDEEAEKYDAGRMTFTEISTEAVLKAAEKNKEDLRMRNEAVKVIGVTINRVRKAMAKQKEYDKATVDSIVRLARMMIENGYMDNMSRSEVKRLMTLAKNATGKTDITKQANAVVDLMLKHQLKAAEAVQQKLLSTKGSKVNASGVEVQAGLDIMGQRTIKAMKEGIELDEAALTERIADVNDRMGGTDKTLAANAAEEYEGLMMAKDYHDMIRQSEQDEAKLRHELDQAKEDVKNGTLGRKDYKELAARIDAALRKNMAERVTAFTRLNQQLAEVINGSKGRAREFREKQMERVREIQHNANSDMKGTSASEHKKAARINKVVNSGIVRFLFKPVATFDEMLRFFGKKSVDGMGYLWQRFMGGYIDAADTEWRSLKKDHDALDEKVSDVMGEKMRWSDLFSMERKMDSIEVEFYDLTTDEEGNSVRVKEKHQLTQGNALYIYMVNKMDDGAMKLRRMGITDEDVDRIAGQLDPRFLQLADWIQDEFLPKKREAFNAVHMRMFGAPMAAIEEYFPLVTNSRSRGKNEDISEQDKGETKPSTITGSIIKRKVNTTPLDVTNADAFDVLLGHLRDMEHWAAFAELNRDMNTLLSYKHFKNQVLNTASVRFGGGETLWNNFKDVCAIAADVYHPKVNQQSLDNAIVNISKGVTSAKINFRLYTALKQLLSYPAFLSEANPIELAKSTGRPAKAFNWALDNLPGFAERWQSRQAGDSRLKDTDADWDFWKNKFVDTARRWGMTPNAFVDGITVAMGAKAIYESKMKGYLKAGYSEAEAKEKALKEASAAVNETQQSSQNAYLSAMQLDRTVASVALTVFRNASMGYERRLLRAVDNIKRKFTKGYKEESIEFMRKKMVREGLTEEQAKAASERAWNISIAKDVANVVIFGYVMQLAWNLGSNLMYLVFGDDDDEKGKMWEDAALHALAGPVEGLSGGSVISEVYNMARSGKKISNYNFQLLPIMSDLQTTMKHMEQDKVRGMQDIVNLVIQAGVGVNPQTITDAAVAIVDAADGDLGVGKEIGLCALRIMQVPQSQLDQLYIDELGMSAKDAKGLPMEKLAQRYAAYKRMKDAPLTGWAYSDEAKEKVDKRYVNKFVKLIQERVANMDDEALERNMDGDDDVMLKKYVAKEVAGRLDGKATAFDKAQSDWKEETKRGHETYQRLCGYVDLCEDIVLQKAQADADKAYEAALEAGDTKTARQQGDRASAIERSRKKLGTLKRGGKVTEGDWEYKSVGLGDSKESDEQIMENIRAMRSRYMEYYGLKGKKE